MPISYTTYEISYPQERNMTKSEYLEKYGLDILYSLTRWDTTIDEAVDQMRLAYGRTAVNIWARKHNVKGGFFYA